MKSRFQSVTVPSSCDATVHCHEMCLIVWRFCLLGHGAVHFDGNFPAFRKNLLPWHSEHLGMWQVKKNCIQLIAILTGMSFIIEVQCTYLLVSVMVCGHSLSQNKLFKCTDVACYSFLIQSIFPWNMTLPNLCVCIFAIFYSSGLGCFLTCSGASVFHLNFFTKPHSTAQCHHNHTILEQCNLTSPCAKCIILKVQYLLTAKMTVQMLLT
jgi:hypothetical protein